MARNIEIKAISNHFHAQRDLAQRLSGSAAVEITQQDTFFKVSTGRLKLRTLAESRGQLIYYQRNDEADPKLSHYHISETNDPIGLTEILSAAYGIRGRIDKTRYLYKLGRTRVHLDVVENLGKFIELEVVLEESDDIEGGESEARCHMERLGIQPSDLITSSYIDLFEQS